MWFRKLQKCGLCRCLCPLHIGSVIIVFNPWGKGMNLDKWNNNPFLEMTQTTLLEKTLPTTYISAHFLLSCLNVCSIYQVTSFSCYVIICLLLLLIVCILYERMHFYFLHYIGIQHVPTVDTILLICFYTITLPINHEPWTRLFHTLNHKWQQHL